MSSCSEKKKKITLKSSDGENFEIEEAVAMQMQTIKHIIEEDECASDVIPVPNVHSTSLSKVVEYCINHAQHSSHTDHTTKALFDTHFITIIDDTKILFYLLLAANYLNIKTLLDLTCQHVAHRITNYTVEQVRDFFNIDNDFTPEEEAEIRGDNAWAFEP